MLIQSVIAAPAARGHHAGTTPIVARAFLQGGERSLCKRLPLPIGFLGIANATRIPIVNEDGWLLCLGMREHRDATIVTAVALNKERKKGNHRVFSSMHRSERIILFLDELSEKIAVHYHPAGFRFHLLTEAFSELTLLKNLMRNVVFFVIPDRGSGHDGLTNKEVQEIPMVLLLYKQDLDMRLP